MKSEKEKLQVKSVNALKAAAKRIGANVIDPKTGKAKTKQQLINGILIKERLSGKSMGGNAKATTAKAKTVNNTELKRITAAQKKLDGMLKTLNGRISKLKK